MNCNNRISASAMLVAATLAFSPTAWSLGLGEAKVESYLNQPLRARIDLISQASDDLTSVTARLASAEDYELIGASIEGISVPLRFTVEDIDGDAYIAATSNLPITDPVLRVIVEVNWSSGRMLREYTLFLDPPVVSEAAPAPRISQSKAAAPAPAAAPPKAAAEPAVPVTAAPAPASPAAPTAVTPVAGSEYGPVRSGETLWGIAREWSRGSGLGVNQVMIAIQRENPDAFLNDNINLLKRGAILRMPDAAQIEQISAAAAFREVQAQSDEFTGGRAAKSVASPSTPLLSSESAASGDREAEAEVPQEDAAQAVEPDESQAEEEVTGEAEPADLEAAGSGEGQDLLELIPPSADSELDEGYGFEESAQPAGDNGDVQALRENLARTEEELINQQQQNSYLEERIRELESELEAAGDGSVADADLANMQERLREERQAVVKQTERSDPWYSRLSIWLIGLLVAIAAVAGWLLSRRGQAAAADEAVEESLRSIQSEAEDVLRVLGDETQAEAAQAAEPETDTEPESDTEAKSDTESETGSKPTTPARKRHSGDADAELLDEDSSDPEIQLDLARAYISMGDKEAARVILEEVVSNGTEEQQEEAKKMLGIL